MAIIKGHDLMLFVDGSSIGFATSHSLSVTGNTTEISHKDLVSYWQAATITSMNWEASTDNLYSLDSGHGATLATLYTAMTAGTEVVLILATQTGPNGTGGKVPEPDGVGQGYKSGLPKFTGNAVITSLSINAPDGDNASFSVTFSGVGPLKYSIT
jgi:predicted secreted protein